MTQWCSLLGLSVLTVRDKLLINLEKQHQRLGIRVVAFRGMHFERIKIDVSPRKMNLTLFAYQCTPQKTRS